MARSPKNSDSDSYVDLNRRYVTTYTSTDNEELASSSYLWAKLHNGVSLEKLMEQPLVVALGEAGSGKTEEFRQQVRLLRAAGKPAFFIRLEELVKAPLAEVIGQEQIALFERWKRSRQRAYFFLDSVDEAKLVRVADFHFAIRKFADILGKNARQRASVLISSRVSEWHPETDGPEVCACFGVPRSPRPVTSDEDDEGDDKPGVLKEVQLVGLDHEQVLCFAEARGIKDAKRFGDALDKAHAWEFARRPLDVIGLIELWKERGHIGTLTELVEFDVERKLRERSDRRGVPLTAQEARDGAEALAAAAVFGRNFGIKVPDDALVSVEAFDGRAAVPESLNDAQYQALLARPLFDGASFGRIRFHHRRVREYLAAQWVEKRLAADCPLEELDALFFARPEGKRVLRASLAPVAVWLCYGTAPHHGAMRQWILEASPGLHLRYGDPQALPLAYKRSLLQVLKALASERKWTWLETDQEALARLADPRLASEISSLILDASLASDFRTAMLRLVHYGALAGCVDAALQIIMSPTEREEMKTYAGIALRGLAQPEHRRALAQYVVQEKSLPCSVTHLATMESFPDYLDGLSILQVLLKGRKPRHRYSDISHRITGRLHDGLRLEEAGLVLAELVRSLRSEPRHLAPHRGSLTVSQAFSWARVFLPAVMNALLKKPLLDESELANASVGLWLTYDLKANNDRIKAEIEKLEQSTHRHPSLRRRHYHDRLAELRTHERGEPFFWRQIFWLNDVLMQPSAKDIDWLLADMVSATDERDRLLALNLVIEHWEKSGRPRWLLKRIKRETLGKPALSEAFSEIIKRARFSRVRCWWRQKIWLHLSSKHWWERHAERARSVWLMVYNQCYLTLRVARMARGNADRLVIWVINHTPDRSGSHWADVDWKKIRKQWGVLISSATRRGSMSMWRRHEASLPHEKPSPNQTSAVVIVSLAGLRLAWETNAIDFKRLNADEARRVTRYALNEINGYPPWVPELLESQPEACGTVLSEAVEGEWRIAEKTRERWQVLQTLVWHGLEFGPDVRACLLRLLGTGNPPQEYSLNLVLTALIHSSHPPRDELRELARVRCMEVSAAPLPPGFSLWVTLWIQLDPLPALTHWEHVLALLPEADDLFVSVAASLNGRDVGQSPRFADTGYLTAEVLGRLIPITFRHVRLEEDIHRGEGGYSPCGRDYAQEFREGLLRRLGESSEPEAVAQIRRLATEPQLIKYRDFLLHTCEELLERQAESRRWKPSDVRLFAKEHEIEPQTDYDLYRVVSRRLSDIKNEVERSDTGLRRQVHPQSSESDLRTWLANELTRRRKGRYSIEQESVIDRDQRPDVRAENPNTSPVPIEIKWACAWSVPVLLERLENQLMGQYLRAYDARYGIFFVGVIKPGRLWDNPTGGCRLNFAEVVKLLEAKAAELTAQANGLKQARVIPVDFRE